MRTMTRTKGALLPARCRKGIIRSIGLCGSNGLAYQTHKSMRLYLLPAHKVPDAIKIHRAESICIFRVIWQSQQLTVLEAK